jgi:hypothetical protein
MPRPLQTTCQGCGDPEVPVGEKGAIPKFCFACAGHPRNRAHKGWNGDQLNQLRRERRRQRLADGEIVDLDIVAGDEPTPERHREMAEAIDEAVEEEEEHDHAAVVADDQVAAQSYWGGGNLQPPDGPVTLNTPVYDPGADPLIGGDDGLGPVEEAAATPDLVAVFEPLDEDADYPDTAAAVCVAPGCELPDPGHGHDLFCRNHWRLIRLETRQRVLGAPPGPARNSAIHRALFEIRRAAGG